VKIEKGVVQNTAHEIKHPVQSLSQHPLLTTLDAAAGVSALGRTGGAIARGLGSTVEGAGLRGKFARAGSTVRPPISMSNDAGQPVLVHRSYSKDLTRKALQVQRDKAREPLRDERGNVVTAEVRGRKVPVLKSSEGEQVALAKKRGDFLSSRAHMGERTAREQMGRETKVRGVKGRAAKDIVSMVVEGTITSAKHFEADLTTERDRLRAIVKKNDYSAPGDKEAVATRLALVEKVLGNPKALAQAPKIVAEGERLGATLHAGDVENAAAGLGNEHALERSSLSVTALQHLGARHFTVEEHQALERQGRKAEQDAAERYQKAKTPAERQAALADLNTARENRIAVSGRHPEDTRAHENAQQQLRVAQQRAKDAHAAEEAQTRKITALATRHKSERGREAHHGPVAVYHVGDKRFTLRQDAVEYARAQGVPVREIQRLATTAGEASRVGELSNARRALVTAKERRRSADKAVRQAEKNAKGNPLPETNAGIRYGENSGRPAGSFLSNDDVKAFLQSRGRNPNTVAYLPHRADVRGQRAHHAQFRPGSRPVLDSGPTRTGSAYLSGVTESSEKLLHDAGVRQKVQLNKARAIDRVVAEHGMRHPAWAKAQRGEPLTPAEQRIVNRGGYLTAKQGLEVQRQSEGRLVPMRAYNSSLDSETQRIIREELQGPGAMDSLSQRLLENRRVTNAEDKGAPNVVMMDATLVHRLEQHVRPAGEIEKLFQYANRAFRLAVLPQDRWLTGNFFENFIVRLGVKGSGLVNIPGLLVDLTAERRILKAGLEHGDPVVRQAAQEIQAQQTDAGLFVGGKAATVRRTPGEFMPERSQRAYGRVVSKLPVVDQMAQMVQQAGHFIVAPLHAFFWVNRHAIENPSARAAFGHEGRAAIQAITGSWIKSLTLGKVAVEQAMRGLVNTPEQEAFMHAQYEMLGKYAGQGPTMRALTQSVAPFLPWMLNAARFVFWTMPAHHTVKTALLVKTQQVMAQDWKELHQNTPPGELRDAIPYKGGWIDLARYTPYGASIPVIEGGGWESVTGQFTPQLAGIINALGGRDPFGNDLKVEPTKSNPEGKPGTLEKLALGAYSAIEAGVPLVSTIRRLREGGATAYGNSTVVTPRTKPGTKHTSALNRTFNPFRPTYLNTSGGSETVIEPQSQAASVAGQNQPAGQSKDLWDHVNTEQQPQVQGKSLWDVVK
jgi:hypothetical protein